MTATPLLAVARPVRPHRVLRALDHPSDVFAHLAPNWFASVMGTGIVANAAAGLPVNIAGVHGLAVTAWAAAALWLALLSVAWVLHWVRHPATARSWASHPVFAYFWGAPAMALMTVGSATLLVGGDVVGRAMAVRVDAALWAAGTALGLGVAAWIPRRMRAAPHEASGVWLMPVVPPMVSASAGALLLPHLAGVGRTAMLLACCAMFVLSLVLSVRIVARVVRRLVRHGVGPARMVPTLWILLGPMEQSVTAAHALGADQGGRAASMALAYGLVMMVVAMSWFVVATAITARAAHEGLPFSLTWWSFTFPVGTCVTGASGLAVQTGDGSLRALAAVLFLVLLAAWVTVAIRTARAAWEGSVFLPS